jgi:hypothetical protein
MRRIKIKLKIRIEILKSIGEEISIGSIIGNTSDEPN